MTLKKHTRKCVYIYIYILIYNIHIHIYIYIYIHKELETKNVETDKKILEFSLVCVFLWPTSALDLGTKSATC